MATWLRQSTAREIKLGPFVDQTDGFSPETGLTIAQADVRLAKNEGDWAQKNEATTLVHEENGWYRCLLNATDTDTLGILIVAVNEAGALPVWREFLVVPANVWDSFLGTDLLQIDLAQWLGTAAATPTVAGVPEVDETHHAGTLQTAGDVIADTNDIQARLPAALDTGRIVAKAEIVTDKTGYALAAAEYTALVNLIWDELTSEGRVAGSFGQLFKDNLNAAITSRAVPGDAMDLVVDAVDALALAADAVDEIWDETFAELPQAAPSATPTARAAIMLLFMMARNASQSTSTERRVKNDAGIVIAKATMSDDGVTFDQGELVAGP